MSHDLDRLKKDQDLMFQKLDERELLRKQAIRNETATKLLNKMQAASVPMSVISEMLEAGQNRTEIMEFLDAEATKKMVRLVIAERAASGKPISEERAYKLVERLRADDDDEPSSK